MVNAMHSGRLDSLRDLNILSIKLRIYGYIHYTEIPRSSDRPECIAFTINLNKVYIVSEEFMKYMKNLKKFYIGMGDILN